MTTVPREFEITLGERAFRVQDVEMFARDGDVEVRRLHVDLIEEWDETAVADRHGRLGKWVAPALTADQVNEIRDAILAQVDSEMATDIEDEIEANEASWDAEARGDAMREEAY